MGLVQENVKGRRPRNVDKSGEPPVGKGWGCSDVQLSLGSVGEPKLSFWWIEVLWRRLPGTTYSRETGTYVSRQVQNKI